MIRKTIVGEALLKCLFKHHPLKNPILGFAKTINQFTVEDVAETASKLFCTTKHGIDVDWKFFR